MADLIKWEPFREMTRFFTEMDKTFAEFFRLFSEELDYSQSLNNHLNLQIRDEAGEILITGKIPGNVKDNLDVVVHQDRVTVGGEYTATQEKDGLKHYQWSKFTRNFLLPEKVRSEKAAVNLQNGELNIRVPKEHQKP